MHRAVIVVVLAFAAAACGSGTDDGPAPGPTTSTSRPPVSPTAIPSVTGPTASGPMSTGPAGPTGPTAPADLDLPADAPTFVGDQQAIADIRAGDLSLLAPPGATIVAATAPGPFDRIGLFWERGSDPFRAERGYVLWLPTREPGWRAAYAFTDGRRSGVLGITQEGHDDLTGDDVDEILTLESTGGSGACGVVRVISPSATTAAEILQRDLCDANAFLEGGHLVIRAAVFGPNDPHCCPSAFRTTTFEWNGKRLVPGEVEEEPVG